MLRKTLVLIASLAAVATHAGYKDVKKVKRQDGTRYYDVTCKDRDGGENYTEQTTATDVINGNVCRSKDRANFTFIKKIEDSDQEYWVKCVGSDERIRIKLRDLRNHNFCVNKLRAGGYRPRGGSDREKNFYMKVFKDSKTGKVNYVEIYGGEQREQIFVSLKCRGFRCLGQSISNLSVELRGLKKVNGSSALWMKIGTDDPTVYLRQERD